jgi:SAM-dependent methyltransferase
MTDEKQNETSPNRDQASYWNDRAGPCWVAMEQNLDAQLAPFGIAVMDRLALARGERALDVGCGAGATSLALAERVAPGQVVGVDISAPLLERARQRAAAVPNLSFELADAQTFAFPPGVYDVIFSRFGVMFFADPVGALRNLRTSLKAGGRLGFVCWRAMRENPSFTLPLEAGLRFVREPPEPPPPNAPGPFAFADADRLRAILHDAGYQGIEIAPLDVDIVFGGRDDFEGAVELAMQVGPMSRLLPTIEASEHERVRAAIRDALAPHHGPTGVRLPSATWIVTASA